MKTPDCAGLTHPGRVRPGNEDHFLVARLSRTALLAGTSLTVDPFRDDPAERPEWLLIVADGIGGTAGGARASSLAVAAAARSALEAFAARTRESDDRSGELRGILDQCRARLTEDAAGDPDRRSMGTTLTMAFAAWPWLQIAHVGDSRCYVLRGDRLDLITRDHTLARALAEMGINRPVRADPGTPGSWLINALTSDRPAEPDLLRFRLQPDDVVLLCTDGLTRHVPEETIARILRESGSARRACRELVDQANRAGGFDNITAVVARFRTPAAESAPSRETRPETTVRIPGFGRRATDHPRPQPGPRSPVRRS